MFDSTEWVQIGILADIPRRGARCVKTEFARVAVFRTDDDRVFAIEDRCPHRGGPLSQGIVHGNAVTCPLHNWQIDLASGRALGADEGGVRSFAVRQADGGLWLLRAELEAVVSAAA